MNIKLNTDIYCISLKRSKRYYEFKKYIKNKSLEIKFAKVLSFKSKDFHYLKKNLSYEKHMFYNKGRMPTDREIACSISHQIAINNSDSKKNVLILEDDARFKIKISLLKRILSIIEKTHYYDIILLGYSKSDKKTEDYINLVNPFLKKIKLPIKRQNYYLGERFEHSTSGAVGYVVTPSAKKKLIQFDNVFRLADDWVLLDSLGLKIGYLNPTIIREDITMISSLDHTQDFIRPKKTNIIIIDILLSLRRRIIFLYRLLILFFRKWKNFLTF